MWQEKRYEDSTTSLFRDLVDKIVWPPIYGFRGHAKASWELLPSLERERPVGANYKACLDEEASIVTTFQGGADRFMGTLEVQVFASVP